METPLEKLNARTFSEHLHSKFTVKRDNGSAVELELSEVTEPPPLPKLELFTLIFRGPAAPRLPQKIHRLEHARLGTISIFLTAIGGDEGGTLYEAVFNRVRNQRK